MTPNRQHNRGHFVVAVAGVDSGVWVGVQEGSGRMPGLHFGDEETTFSEIRMLESLSVAARSCCCRYGLSVAMPEASF